MKNKSIILFLSLSICGLVFVSSCKKKDDAAPSPTAATDNVDMGANASTTVNVLANDTYSGSASVTVSSNTNYGTIVVNNDNTITYSPKTNFFGTATYTYTVKDDNGSGSGNIVIKVGTDAQIKTYSILSAYKSMGGLALFAIDGDTSRIYKNTYLSAEVGYNLFDNNQLYVSSNNIMPRVGDYTFSIVGDGTVLTHANSDNNVVIFTVVDHFTATAKKYDGTETREVHGFTIQFGGHTLDYATTLPCEFTNPSSCIN